MKYIVIVSPEAEDDLKKAFSWYEDKRQCPPFERGQLITLWRIAGYIILV